MRNIMLFIATAMLSLSVQASDAQIPLCCPRPDGTLFNVNVSGTFNAASAIFGDGCLNRACTPADLAFLPSAPSPLLDSLVGTMFAEGLFVVVPLLLVGSMNGPQSQSTESI